MNNAIVKRYPLANSFPILLIVCLILEQGYGLLPIPRYLFIVLVGVFFFYYKKGTSYRHTLFSDTTFVIRENS